MKGFLLGVLVAGLAFAGYLLWKRSDGASGNRPAIADGGLAGKELVKEKKKRKRRGATGLGAPGGSPESEPEPVKLSAADLKMVGQGDDLSRPDVIRLDLSDDSGTHELSQDDIDGRFRAREEEILSCISRARPDEETYVPGRVTVKFRIQRSGNVRGVRVEAPAILQRGGLTGCIKNVVGALRFPPSNGSQVVSYPFSLT